METRANYIAIGVFTLLAFAMAFGFIYWLVRYNETGEARLVELIIPGNAGGLQKGNGVLFNGLRVGNVVSVRLSEADPENVYAVLKINSETPLREDTNVTIASQPLTGLANVSLVGGSADKDLILKRDVVPPLRAKPSSLNDTLEAAAKTVEIANGMLAKVDQLIDENKDSIGKTVSNVEAFSTAVANNSEHIDAFLQNVGEASKSITALSKTLDGVSKNVDAIVAAVEPERIKSTLTNVDKITGDIARSSGELGTILETAKKTVGSFSNVAANLDKTVSAIDGEKIGHTLQNVDAIVAAIDPAKVKNTLSNVDKISGDIARNSGELDRIVSDTKKTVNSFSGIAANLDTKVAAIDDAQISRTLANVEAFSGEMRETLKKVDGLVGALDQERIGKVVENVENFTARLDKVGTEIDAIIADAKTATGNVTDFTRTLADNRENFDKIVKDASIVSERLIKTSEAVTRLVGRVDGLVEADGRGLFVEAADAAKAIRRVAESFETRADAISGGLERFSTRGLGDIEALIAQSREAVARLEGIVQDFENNPSQFLLGGKRVPEYQRQRR